MPFPRFPRLVATLFLFVFSAFSAAHAATWVLSNGDRLSGVLVSEAETEIVIEHAVLGRVTLARASLQGQVTETTESIASAAVVPAAITPPPPPATDETPEAKSPPRFKWMNRTVELGYSRQDGARNKEDLSARAQAEARVGSNSFRGTARVTRSEAENQLVVNRQDADFRWRYDFDKRTFAQTLTTYAADDIRKINLSLEQQVGGGYRIIDARRQQVNVGLGAVVQRLARDGYEDYTALLGSAFQDFTLQWNERLKFTQDATLLFSESSSISQMGGQSTVAAAPSDGNYRVKFNAALETKMTDKVSLRLRYEYDYDHSVPEPVLRTDSRLTTSIGYAW